MYMDLFAMTGQAKELSISQYAGQGEGGDSEMRQLILILNLVALSRGVAALNATCYSNGGAVLETPSSPGFVGAAAVFNEKISNSPAAVAYAYTASQVQDIVRCARAGGIKAVPRGGGHGYEGKSQSSILIFT